MLRPFLLIGIGGSGGKTLRVVREDLEWRLRESGWPASEPFPQAWQFLHIDVAAYPDGDEPDLPPQLPVEDFLGLVNAGLNYGVLDRALMQNLSGVMQLDSLGGWRPDPHKVTVAIDKGAGQFRALGRVITLTRLDAIKSRIERAVDRITDADVRRQLQRIDFFLGEGGGRPAVGDPVVVVVSSIAGGSGAGGILDVCDVLRTIGKSWLDESVGILFAPDVFDEIPEANRKGVRPNALATLSELMAGYWTRGYNGITEASSTLFGARGLQSGGVQQVGPRYPNLVGARNSDVFYGSQNEVYRGTGKAIVAWMTSERLQTEMTSFFMGNRASSAVALRDRLDLKLNGMETPFTAMGFARVSLGRELFAEYAAQRLAREGVERVLRHHLGQRSPHDDITDTALVARVADEAWLNFLAGSRLDERGPERNDVLDALRDADAVQRQVREWAEEVTGRIAEGTPAEGLPVSAWVTRLEGALQEQGPVLAGALRARRLEAARTWVAQIQEHLAEHTLRAVSTHGGPVTLALLRKLITEANAAVRELPDEENRAQGYTARARDGIRAKLTGQGAERIPARRELLGPAVQEAAKVVLWQAEADLRRFSAELLRDLIPSLLEPLAQAVEFGIQELAQDERPTGSTPSRVQYWPSGDDVPPRLRPARNEFLLDDVERFPGVLTTQLVRSTGQTTPLAALATAVAAVVTDADGLDAGGRRKQPGADTAARTAPVERLQAWVPNVPELHEGISAAARASFRVHLKADELLRRAQDWVANRERPLGRHVTMSLHDHLEDPEVPPEEQADRLRRFTGQLHGAVERAKPLVNIDPQVLMAVHDEARPQIHLIMGKIPLSAQSAAGRGAREVLVAAGVGGDRDANLFGEPVGSFIDVFSVLAQPLEPVVFSSLMQPIAEEWAAARLDPNTRQAFWRWRRSRTLPESIPAAPPVRRAMVRGWFTGLALGQVRVGRLLQEATVEVWVPAASGAGGGWAAMPSPVLRPVTSSADAIGAVLESLPLALLDVYSARSVDPLRPYQRLTALGASGSDAGIEVYEQLNQDLSSWIRDGAIPPGFPPPDEQIGDQGSAPELRRDAVERRFVELRERYRQRFEEVVRKGELASVPRDYELRHDILAALDDLIAMVGESIPTERTGAFL